MQLTWKIILLLAVLAIGGSAVIVYKNRPTTSPNQNTTTEQKTYNPDAKPITDAEINLLIKDAGAEPPAEADEEKDSATVTSDNQELNNFDNAYVSTDF